MPRQPFLGFVRSDFSAFSEEKREDPTFNEERKVVWEKMRILKSWLDWELKQRGFALEGKVSQYWINYTKQRVTGIWVAYTHIKPYYIVCQLNCGIYKDGVFAGIEINRKARDNLNHVAAFIDSNKDEFLQYINKLDPQYLDINYGSWAPECDETSTSDLDALRDTLYSESDWFDLGEYYPKTETFLTGSDFISRIGDVFELLFPLYLVFAGLRPIGQRRTDKLLRVGDAREKEITQREKELATEVSQLSDKELDELIATIDQRNKSESQSRLHRETKTYRRNPALSSMLKQKYKDRCQICRNTFKVDEGFFCDTHHLKPLKAGGMDVSENMVVLCPNHHRIFDRSRVEIVSRSRSKFVVRAGGHVFDICL